MFIGTLYPLALEVADRRQDFGRRAVFQPDLRTIVRSADARGPVRAVIGLEARRSLWRRAAPDRRRHGGAGRDGGALALTHGGATLAPFAIGLAVFAIAGALTDLAERTGLFRIPCRTRCARARGLPRSAWGTAFAHAGVGVALIGIVWETTWNSEYIATDEARTRCQGRGYELKLDGITQRQGPNFREMIAQFSVSLDGQPLEVMTPSKRSFTTRGMSTTEAALLTRGASQLYISLGEASTDGGIAVRIYHKPLVLLIWFGPVLMAFGGAVVAVGPAAAGRRAEAGKGRTRVAAGGVMHARRSSSSARSVVDGGDARLRGAARRDHAGPRSRKRVRATCRANCAAWCARTSRSTIPMRRWRATCGCWCASGSRPETVTAR